ncbi:MAG: hypothetical protein CME25_00660 [Gemmatimonadetes bacterium]|nr:hypothetical protein [Gemmatimonadota bacterium]
MIRTYILTKMRWAGTVHQVAERILEDRQRTQFYNGEGAVSQLKTPIRSSVWDAESVAISISIGSLLPSGSLRKSSYLKGRPVLPYTGLAG